MYVWMDGCMYVHMTHTHIYIYIYIHIHTYVQTYIYIYMDIYIYGTPPPLTYPFLSFETQGWVGAGGSGTERRPENAKN